MPSFAKLSSWLLSRRWRGSRADSSDSLEPQLKRPPLATSTSTLSTLSTGSMSSLGSEGPKVCIDAVTEVPYELYLDLVAAGKSARARGQHRKVRPQGRGSGQGVREASRRKTHLISCEAGPV
jgi:hypothetical protein